MNEDDATARLALPLLYAAQAQKEDDHNEALVRLDLATQAAVEEVGLDVPPASPAPGACWIVGDTPSGSWAGQAGALAGWTAGGWRFVAPFPGMAVWDRASGTVARRETDQWRRGEAQVASLRVGGQQVVGARQPAIIEPFGGTTVDAEARGVVTAILAALRAHGLIAI